MKIELTKRQAFLLRTAIRVYKNRGTIAEIRAEMDEIYEILQSSQEGRQPMKTEIKPKYNVGDEVYAIDVDDDGRLFPALAKILEVKVLKNATKWEWPIQYSVQKNGLYYYYPEERIFATKEQCQKYCDRMNELEENR